MGRSASSAARQNRYTDPLHTASAERRHTTLTWVERNFGYAVARAYAGHTDGGDTGATSTYVRASLAEVAAALAALTGEAHPLAPRGAVIPVARPQMSQMAETDHRYSTWAIAPGLAAHDLRKGREPELLQTMISPNVSRDTHKMSVNHDPETAVSDLLDEHARLERSNLRAAMRAT